MRDLDLNSWRAPLQEARGLYKKILATPAGPEREVLLEEHKKLLEEARKNLGQEQTDGAEPSGGQ